METIKKIIVAVTIDSTIDQVWNLWTETEYITQWNHASDDWHTPRATNDLKVGGKFLWRMEAKDGSMGFDFAGTYTAVIDHQLIKYELADGRNVVVEFNDLVDSIRVVETFQPETINSHEMQRAGWQAILNNFKEFVENYD